MPGAIFVHLFVLHTGVFAALVPAILLGLVVSAGWKERGELEDDKGFLTLR
jgi:hypothetical protein